MPIKPATELIGSKVVYRPFENSSPSLWEEGVITSFNDSFVFVRFGNDVNSKACKKEDLYLNGY